MGITLSEDDAQERLRRLKMELSGWVAGGVCAGGRRGGAGGQGGPAVCIFFACAYMPSLGACLPGLAHPALVLCCS